MSDDLEFQIQKAIKDENFTIDFENLSGDHKDSDTISTNFSEPIKDGPNDRLESTKIVQKVIRFSELNLESAGSIKNISIIPPKSANETKIDPTNKVDNNPSNYVTILIIAGIAIVCTFLSLAGRLTHLLWEV